MSWCTQGTSWWRAVLFAACAGGGLGCNECGTREVRGEITFAGGSASASADDGDDDELQDVTVSSLSKLGEHPVGVELDLGGGFQARFSERRDTTEISAQPMVVLEATTTLPEGTLYRMHMTRKVRIHAPRDENGVRLTGMSNHAAIYYPEPSRTVKNAPSRIGIGEVHEFGVVRRGKILARFEMLSREQQSLGVEQDTARYTLDRDHVFVQVTIERAVQDLEVLEQLPEGVDAIDFVLRLDVPLSFARTW